MSERWEYEQEAAEEAYYAKLYEEFGPQWAEAHGLADPEEAIREFTAERLQSYYIAHPSLAGPAYDALAYARSLLPAHSKAALVFATTATELTIKTVLLQPIVFGLVHTEALASFITELTTQHTGMDRFRAILTEILARFGGVDLRGFKRSESAMTLWEEIATIQQARNTVIHQGTCVEESTVHLSIAVATSLLTDIFPKVLAKLDLHLHDPGIVCDKRHTTPLTVRFARSESLRAFSFTCCVELDVEPTGGDLQDAITGRAVNRPTDYDLALVRSGTVKMIVSSSPFSPAMYEVHFSQESLDFIGAKVMEATTFEDM